MPGVLDSRQHSRTGSAYQQLTEAGRAVDAMWQEAIDDGRNSDAIDLGEASQSIHRALVALAPHVADQPRRKDFAVDWG
jgi:hypothetical protein